MQPFEAFRKWRSQGESQITISNYPPYQHLEQHFNAAEVVKDIILGLSDGLTVPFALAAGLSSLGNSKLVIYGGVAELVSGSISMGLGGYLAARSELEHYDTERLREAKEVEEVPEDEEQEILDIMAPYGLDRDTVQPIIAKLRANPDKFVDFMMRFELNLERPDPKRSMISGLTIGGSYLVGGLIPLIPYFFLQNAFDALYISIGVTLTTLMIFGYIKSLLVSPRTAFKGALQTLVIGAIAAGASFGIVKAIPEGTA
ncbi:unnamed protein product [Umbelopsis ramanniana]